MSSWTTEKPTEPGLYWWRWGVEPHDSEYPEGAEIVRVWVQPRVPEITGLIWWVSHFDREATKVELRFTGGEWWPKRIIAPDEQDEANYQNDLARSGGRAKEPE